MKIHSSTIFVDEPEYLQLAVVNMWDFSAKRICFKSVEGLGGTHLIGYCLYKKTEISKGVFNAELINVLTQEMKDELIKMGYTLNEKTANDAAIKGE